MGPLLLVLVAALWAMSFGLIRNRLAGLDPTIVACLRTLLAFLVFLPFLRLRTTTLRVGLELGAIGAVQFGLMYLCYQSSFHYLQAHQVALLTITTPCFVALLGALAERRWTNGGILAACLAVAGTALISQAPGELDCSLRGLVLVQLSNVCFAAGQVAFRWSAHRRSAHLDSHAMAWGYLGAVLILLPWSIPPLLSSGFHPTLPQLVVLAYLGIVASGLGFFLFNAGARRSSLPVLAVLNNAKIPLAVVVSVVVFGETIDLARTALGILLFLPALYLAGRTEFARPPRVSDLTGLFISSVFFASTCTMDLIW
ncbi:MAG: hypothetical protein A2284_03515 [Deltaproteobacteria bacterium RIFOXYA12_FULL_61_11]|nr:MAG: hypothetical protein A2284_03515 [Deltaproteobacteria bacterium RIFOXYA12_FULL_61_11]